VRANLETFERLVAHAARGPACWAELVGLGARLAVRASELSGGERRLLELARALVGRPRVLVCDEPFAGIDPLASSRVAALLRAEAERGLAVLLSDHHAALALRLCDRAQLLLGGEMHVEQVPERFARDPLVREHYLGPG
jgi:ABC-type lipopolysaccharide export system ATPase subunit